MRQDGGIQRQTSKGFIEAFDPTAIPDGLTLASGQAFLNLAGHGNQAYAVLRSSTLPEGLNAAPMPEDPLCRPGLFDVVVRLAREAEGTLHSPEILTAFESAQRRGHVGGGLVLLENDMLAFARGDHAFSATTASPPCKTTQAPWARSP